MKWTSSEYEENSDKASQEDLDTAEAMLAIEKDTNERNRGKWWQSTMCIWRTT